MRVLTLLIAAAVVSAPLLAQDATRGARLYEDTAKVTGKPVGACIACHADMRTLRELISNRGGNADDARALARWLEAVIAGAQPGAVNAKAQYRGVLTQTDLRDLAAYIAGARRAGVAGAALAGATPHQAGASR
jgi:cytochrome c553